MGLLSSMRMPKMRVKPLPLAVMALATALAGALGGCSASGPVADGPLGGGTPPGVSVCAPGRVGQPQAFGIQERYINHGHATVVLDRIALLHPHHERLIGSYAVPGLFLVGVLPWPLRHPDMPSRWKLRRPVPGFRLALGRSFSLVLGVAATATGMATSRGMVLYYHDSAGSYMVSNDLAMLIAVRKPGCS
jgi:hypothetical protein